MKQKSLEEKFSYLNKRPLITNALSVLDSTWTEQFLSTKNPEDSNILCLEDKCRLPTRENILQIFYFFRNIDMSLKNNDIAVKVLSEVKKYWNHANIPIQHDWWIRRCILNLNETYINILRNLRRNSAGDIEKRHQFVQKIKELFVIASPTAEKELHKDKILGKKKAIEDLMYLESQRTDRVAKLANFDKNYNAGVKKSKKRKCSREDYNSN